MEQKKNLCAQIPLSLHAQVSEAKEAAGQTTSEYITNLLTRIQDSIAAEYPGYNQEGYVFCQENGQPYEPRTYQDLFKRCVRQAGIGDTNFHALRHTFATRSLEQGMDVVTLSRLLGHANPSITMDKYGHALDDHKRSSIGKLGGLYAGAKKTPSPKRGQER